MGHQIDTLPEIALEGFQVVSGDMFSHFPKTSEPSCTLWNSSISFSKASIIALNCCEHILIRVSSKDKCLLLSPTTASDKDRITWTKGVKNVQAKKIDCKQFTTQLFATWNLDPQFCYRTYGRIVTVNNKIMLLFDFRKAESWKCRNKPKE